jgi:hypothetical protein
MEKQGESEQISRIKQFDTRLDTSSLYFETCKYVIFFAALGY